MNAPHPSPQGHRPLRLGLVGITGAMGQRVLRVLPEFTRLALAAVFARSSRLAAAEALSHAHHQAQVLCTADADAFAQACDIVIDFSAPAQCGILAPRLACHPCCYVVASTGLDAACEAALDAAGRSLPLLQAANLSLGVQVLTQLAQEAARTLSLGAGWDTEIVELHHRRKVDGPSGTALHVGAALARGDAALQPRVGRTEQAASGRPDKELGYSVVRGGDVAGEHTVYFFGNGERLELTHRSQSADIFARGALTAALRLQQAPPGRYTMQTLPELAAPGRVAAP